MPYEVFLAFRYLRARHKRRLARVTAFAAVFGIGIGVAALIVAFALSNGFRDEMRTKILTGTAHISVLRADSQPLRNQQELIKHLRAIDGVVSAATTTYDGAVAVGPKGSSYAVIRGVDPEAVEFVVPKQWLREGTFDSLLRNESAAATQLPSVVVGSELAKRLGLVVGDSVQVMVAGVSETSVAKPRRLRVSGIFSSGLFEYDSTWIYLPLETATSFVGESHVAAVISVRVDDADQVSAISAKIREALGSGYTTVDWQQANQPLFAALALERRMGLFVIGLIIAIGALNITTMLILVVVERRRDIAILGALGATRNGVMRLFIIEGAVVGALGALAGVVLGLIGCLLGNSFKIVSLPADVYSISHVPFNAHLSEVLVAALIAFALSVLATIYPARAASRFRPVETLRESG
jgi:lipoprotein-releasing system permease protein